MRVGLLNTHASRLNLEDCFQMKINTQLNTPHSTNKLSHVKKTFDILLNLMV